MKQVEKDLYLFMTTTPKLHFAAFTSGTQKREKLNNVE